MNEKTCTKCKVTKPAERFSPRAKAKDGLCPHCKDCVNEISRKWYIKNAERLKPIRKEWVAKNREQMRKLQHDWGVKNRERRKAWERAYYTKTAPERERLSLERKALRDAQWASGAEARRKKALLRKEETREKRLLQTREWRKKNPERCRALSREKKARKKNATVGNRKDIVAFYKHVMNSPRLRCHYCNKATRRDDRHVDHIIPLARGGFHTASNLCCACSDCNMRKHTKTDEEFTGQLRLV